MLPEPSPKVHDHEVGEPADVSVNWTVCPAFGEVGDQVKLAVGAVSPGCTVIDLVMLSDPFELPTVRVIEYDPVEL